MRPMRPHSSNIYQVKPDYGPVDQMGPARPRKTVYRPSTGNKIVGRPCVYENAAPVRVQTSSKHRAGLHDMS